MTDNYNEITARLSSMEKALAGFQAGSSAGSVGGAVVAEELSKADLLQRESVIFMSGVDIAVGESAKDAVVRNVQAAVPADRWSAASRVLQGIEVLNNYEMAPGRSGVLLRVTDSEARRVLYSAKAKLRERKVTVNIDMTITERLRKKALWSVPGFKEAHDAAVAMRKERGTRPCGCSGRSTSVLLAARYGVLGQWRQVIEAGASRRAGAGDSGDQAGPAAGTGAGALDPPAVLGRAGAGPSSRAGAGAAGDQVGLPGGAGAKSYAGWSGGRR